MASVVTAKRGKSKPEQLSKIEQFMKAQDDLWNNLTIELNTIGPEHTSAEWKRIWSVHKHYMKKRKSVDTSESYDESSQSRHSQVDVDEPTQPTQPSGASTSHQVEFVADEDTDQVVEVVDVSLMHQILGKLDYIIERLDV